MPGCEALGSLELDVFTPIILRNVLWSSCLLADAADSFREHCMDGIQSNETQFKKHLTNSLMLMTALNWQIGYDKAAKTVHANGTTLKEEALNLGFLTAEEFDATVDPSKMIGSTE